MSLAPVPTRFTRPTARRPRQDRMPRPTPRRDTRLTDPATLSPATLTPATLIRARRQLTHPVLTPASRRAYTPPAVRWPDGRCPRPLRAGERKVRAPRNQDAG